MTRAVNGEKAQAGQVDFVKVVIGMAEQLAGLFGCGVGRDGEVDVVGFGEGDFFVVAVNAGARCEDEFADIMFFCGFEQDHCPIYIDIRIEQGFFDGRSDAGTCGEVDDNIDAVGNNFVHSSVVADVSFGEPEVFIFKAGFDITAFYFGVVKIVEVIDADYS